MCSTTSEHRITSKWSSGRRLAVMSSATASRFGCSFAISRACTRKASSTSEAMTDSNSSQSSGRYTPLPGPISSARPPPWPATRRSVASMRARRERCSHRRVGLREV